MCKRLKDFLAGFLIFLAVSSAFAGTSAGLPWDTWPKKIALLLFSLSALSIASGEGSVWVRRMLMLMVVIALVVGAASLFGASSA